MVRVLALETSTFSGSVAALEADQLLDEIATPAGTRTAQTLAPTIRRLLTSVGWEINGVQLIAVTRGPGSFTGLRIGVTTAKTLAYCTGASLIGVNTLRVLAAQSEGTDKQLVWAVADAQRQQLFAAQFRRDAELSCVRPTAILDKASFLSQLRPGEMVTGPGVQALTSELPASILASPETSWTPRACTVGKLASQLLQRDGPDDLWSFRPNYFRKSAAEEKLSHRPEA